jgi:hypothetical protein
LSCPRVASKWFLKFEIVVNIFPVLQAGVDGILKLMSYSQVENETGIIVEIIIVEKRKVFSLCVAYLLKTVT